MVAAMLCDPQQPQPQPQPSILLWLTGGYSQMSLICPGLREYYAHKRHLNKEKTTTTMAIESNIIRGLLLFTVFAFTKSVAMFFILEEEEKEKEKETQTASLLSSVVCSLVRIAFCINLITFLMLVYNARCVLPKNRNPRTKTKNAQKHTKFMQNQWLWYAIQGEHNQGQQGQQQKRARYPLIWFVFSCLAVDVYQYCLNFVLTLDHNILQFPQIQSLPFLSWISALLSLVFVWHSFEIFESSTLMICPFLVLFIGLNYGYMDSILCLTWIPIALQLSLHSKFSLIRFYNKFKSEQTAKIQFMNILQWIWSQFVCEAAEEAAEKEKEHGHQLYLLLCVNNVLWNERMADRIRFASNGMFESVQRNHFTLCEYERRMKSLKGSSNSNSSEGGTEEEKEEEKEDEKSSSISNKQSVITDLSEISSSESLKKDIFCSIFGKFVNAVVIGIPGLLFKCVQLFMPFYVAFEDLLIYIYSSNDRGNIFLVGVHLLVVAMYGWLIYYVIVVQFMAIVLPFETILDTFPNLGRAAVGSEVRQVIQKFAVSEKILVNMKKNYNYYHGLPLIIELIVEKVGMDVAREIFAFVPPYY